MIHNWDNFRLYRGQIPSADEFREILMSDPIMGTILTYFLKDGMSPKGRFWYRTSIPISRGPAGQRESFDYAENVSIWKAGNSICSFSGFESFINNFQSLTIIFP